ncbi:hypothetical protein PMAYCL1PPCAC_14531, partial [Pristionchus mayeri]
LGRFQISIQHHLCRMVQLLFESERLLHVDHKLAKFEHFGRRMDGHCLSQTTAHNRLLSFIDGSNVSDILLATLASVRFSIHTQRRLLSGPILDDDDVIIIRRR